MPLWVLGHRRDPVLYEDELPGLNVAVFDPRLERSYDSLINRLRAQDLSRSALDLLVLRASSPEHVTEIEHGEGVDRFLADVPTQILGGSWDTASPAPKLRPVSWSAAGGPALDALVFRGPELAAMLERSSAVSRHPGCHYDLPSSAVHAAEFIRLADALQDATDLVRVSDWILPLLGPHTGLVADTGTLLGLLAVVRDEARRRHGWDIPIASLDQYPRGPAAVEELINNFTITRWTDLVLVISVNSTGAIARYAVSHEPRVQLVALRETAIDDEQRADHAGAHTEAVTFVENPVDRWTLNEERTCDECPNLHLLHIHPETYEITADLRWVEQGFDHPAIEHERAFWAIADRTDAVDLHVNHALSAGTEEVRHLSISLDIAALLVDDEFAGRARSVLEAYPRPDLILIPDHATTEALGELAGTVWDSPVHAIPVGALTGEARDAVAAAASVLVMDDVVISTQTLFGLRSHVYDVANEIGRDIALWGFVAVARPPTLKRWQLLRSRYMVPTNEGMRHSLECVQELELPPPGIDHCPWCRERALLQRLLPRLDGSALRRARDRVRELQAAPLRPPLTTGGPTDTSATVGATIGDLRPRAAFAAMAAHGQHLKNQLDRQRAFAEIHYFKLELLLSVIFDAAMFGGLIRTMDARHLRDPTREIDLAAAMEHKDWPPGMLTELAIAASDGKLPVDAVLAYLEGEDGDGTLELLRAVAEYR
jgi:hypothetical protein